MKKYIILGGGISGLSTAWFLKQRYKDEISLAIVEKEAAPGGRIKTTEKEGFLFEEGPRSCRSKGAAGIEMLRLIEQLGLQDEVIAAEKVAKHRFLWRNQRLCPLPSGLLSLVTSPFFIDVVKGVARDLTTAPSKQDDESIYDFVTRRFNSHIADQLFDPLTKGIYAGNIHQLSLKSCFPIMREWEQAGGSMIKGAFKKKKKDCGALSPFVQQYQKSGLIALKSGLETLIRELAGRLEADLLLSRAVTSLHFQDEGVKVDLSDGTTLEADHLISTLPASQLFPLLAPIHQELSGLLADIPAVSTTVVNVGYRKNVLKREGFGYLVPSGEQEDILGVVWNSSVFPQQNQHPEETRLTVMLGSAHMVDFDTSDEGQFAEIALEALSRHLEIDDRPDVLTVKIVKAAIPQYHVGHAAKVAAAERIVSANFPALTLSGNSFHGVAVNDCIAQSKQIAEREKCGIAH